MGEALEIQFMEQEQQCRHDEEAMQAEPLAQEAEGLLRIVAIHVGADSMQPPLAIGGEREKEEERAAAERKRNGGQQTAPRLADEEEGQGGHGRRQGELLGVAGGQQQAESE